MKQYKLTRQELQQKRIPGLIRKDSKYFIDGKQVILQKNKLDFLKLYYSDPFTGFSGHDHFNKIYLKYYGLSRRDIASFITNLETFQIH
jgi:hypothetical protein